jgi:hypothetical protein
MNTDIAKWPVTFERKVKIIIFGGIKLNENWQKRYNTELKQLHGDLDILSFVRINRLNLIGHANGMDGKRKVGHLFEDNRQESRLDDQKTNGEIVYKTILMQNYKLEREVKKQTRVGEVL